MFENVYLNYGLFIVLGLIIGSFLNVVILRFDELESIWLERSHCPKCKKQLRWYDLVPFFSYIFLSGKCRYCKENISLQYPIVEAGTALLFAALFWKFGFSISSLFLILVSCVLIVIFVYDSLKLEIADWLVITGGVIWLGYLVISYKLSVVSYLPNIYGAVALGGFLGLLVRVSKEKWMGAGDIGLGALLGFIVGWPNILVATFAAFVLGSIVGLVLIAAKKKEMQSQLPFAPYLILGMYIALFWGQQILNWYGKGLF